jgi:hypothetical protein
MHAYIHTYTHTRDSEKRNIREIHSPREKDWTTFLQRQRDMARQNTRRRCRDRDLEKQ